jgi:prevent-host-death family protein
MKSVSVRELRNHGGDVLTHVAQGQSVIVTRDGADIAELRPLRRRPAATSELVARRAVLPAVDVDRLRADIDAVIDPAL